METWGSSVARGAEGKIGLLAVGDQPFLFVQDGGDTEL